MTDGAIQESVKRPPRTVAGVLRQLGPGLIIAASIVGSGELIATTKTGAEAGFALLWLVVLGCVIKVFVQIELGRYSIVVGKTTMEGLNEVPGPRWKVNWILWFWLAMFIVSMAQLGGIVGGVGQALAIAAPITESGRAFNEEQDLAIRERVLQALERREENEQTAGEEPVSPLPPPVAGSRSMDDVIWAAIVTALTTFLLVWGRYRAIQNLSTVLVASFTLVSVVNLISLQSLPSWEISWAEFSRGLLFGLPEKPGALTTALAALGIIGVGATELIQYPYWCVEKGYARWVGLRDRTAEWGQRARGWYRVLKWDAWISALIYTFATVVFYLLGAAVLGRVDLNPEGTGMIRTLAEMYVPVFGTVAHLIFLYGAVAVLYSTFFVATAGHARVCADALRVFGVSAGGTENYNYWVKILSGFFPVFCFLVYLSFRAPVVLILASGVMQAMMLPMLGGAALYFRYRHTDARVEGSWIGYFGLWISAAGLLLAGAGAAILRLLSLI